MPTAAAYANRAMAALKAGDAAAAEVDCTAALALDANYLKAWQRRAVARAKSGQLLEAIDDLEAALRCALPAWAYTAMACLAACLYMQVETRTQGTA